MPISFLAPLFLVGLAGLAVPILIHLTDRERRDIVAFPSLMFVQRIPHQTVRRQRIRHWLLFLLRSAAMVLLALAFARPLFDRAQSTAAFGGGRAVVILLDRSYSMGYGDRWDRAVSAAARAIDDLGEADQATLVVFADRAEAVTQPTGEPERLRAALAGVGLEDAATRYTPAFELAAQLLEESELTRREVIVISDFQRTGWDAEGGVRLPDGTEVTAISLADDGGDNIAVTDILLDRQAGGSVDRVSVSARVINIGGTARSDIPVTLMLEGQRVAEATADLGARGAAVVRFNAVPLPRRTAVGVVSAGNDPLQRDNEFHFVISPQQAIPVLILEHPAAGSSETLYLRRALGIGNDPRFAVVTRRVSQVQSEDLVGRPAVILNDVAYPAGAVGRRLRQYVEEGGRALVVLGRRSTPGSWNGSGGFLPGTAGEAIDRWEDGGGTWVVVSYDHPVFEVFKAPHSGDFSMARFFRYRAFEALDSADVLARFDNGAVALAEARVGRGAVVVLTTGLDNSWSDLAIQPVFLPFVHRVARYLSAYGAPRAWVTAGQVLDLESYLAEAQAARAERGVREIVVEAPSGERTLLERQQGGEALLEVREQGLYRLRPLNDRAGLLATIAVNLDPVESDLSAMDPDELVGAMTTGRQDVASATAAVVLTPEDKERRQGLWWYLLITVLLLLAAESALSNRARPARRQTA
jgi:hypothetical protein